MSNTQEITVAKLKGFKELETKIKAYNKKNEPVELKYLPEHFREEPILTTGMLITLAAPTTFVLSVVSLIASILLPEEISNFLRHNAVGLTLGIPTVLGLVGITTVTCSVQIAKFFGAFATKGLKQKWRQNIIANIHLKKENDEKWVKFRKKRGKLEKEMQLMLDQANASISNEEFVYDYFLEKLKLRDKEIPETLTPTEDRLAKALIASEGMKAIEMLSSPRQELENA